MKLHVWQRSHALAKRVYRLTAEYPASERYGLTSQTRRSAANVPMNIAEGSGRKGTKDFARFLDIAASSVSELEYQLLLAADLGMSSTPTDDERNECVEIRKMLSGLRKAILRSDR